MSCGVNEILMFSSLPAQVCGIAIGQCGFQFFFLGQGMMHRYRFLGQQHMVVCHVFLNGIFL
jgi:hypothetical protein